VWLVAVEAVRRVRGRGSRRGPECRSFCAAGRRS